MLNGRKDLRMADEVLEELAFIARMDGTDSSHIIRIAVNRYVRKWRKDNPDEHQTFLKNQQKTKKTPVLSIQTKKRKSQHEQRTKETNRQKSLFERREP